MKITLLRKLSVTALILLFSLAFTNKVNAQASCPYTIQNNLGCAIDIQYTIFGPGCPGSSNIVNIPPGGQYIIQCNEFQGCERADIELNLLRVDGIGFICKPPYSNTVASVSQVADASGIFPGSSCGSIFMIWTPNGCTIQP
ncbi:MAG TPA: hypothetical protein VK826_14835 [Bacteroidia bacterium]|nr:hypothetical protein [Bacteroidia bacterium]